MIEEITGAKQVNVVALCPRRDARRRHARPPRGHQAGAARVRSATLLNALVDFSVPGALGHFVDPGTVERLEARMAKKGYLDGAEMAGTFNLCARTTSSGATSELADGRIRHLDLLQWNADATSDARPDAL